MRVRQLRFVWALGLLGFLPALSRAQADGSQRWAFTTLSTSTLGNVVSAPAAGPDGTIYFGVEVGSSTSTTPSGQLFAVDPANPQRAKWIFTAPDWIDSTPAIGADGTIYFGCWNGVLYALRPDGAKRWELKLGSFIASSPAVAADGTIYVGVGSNLAAVAPDGTLKWSFPAADWIDSSPAIGPDGTIYVGSWDNNLYAIQPDGTEKWHFTTDDNVSTSPAVATDGTVYFGSRDVKVYALTPAGTLKWSFDTGDTVEASPVLGADGTVYVGTNGGRLFALTRDGAERWRFPAATQTALGAISSTPAVRSDGSVVFGTSVPGSTTNAVYAVRANGTQLWRASLGDATDSSPLVTSNAIYIGCEDKKVYAFNSSSGPATADWPQFHRDLQHTGRMPAAQIVVPPAPGRLVNLSVRTTAGSDASTLIVGFVVSGAGSRSLLVRGVGPTLATFGVTGVLADPVVALYSGSNVIATNDNWGDAANASQIAAIAPNVGAFALPNGSRDSAWLSFDVASAAYTVQVTGVGGGTGVALMEAYDAGGSSGARLANVSARSAVGTGAGILIAGFVVNDNACTVLVRGVGPALTQFGVTGALADPQLQIYRGTQFMVENNDWSTATNAGTVSTTAQAVGAFALPNGSRDAALLVTLQPGAYTAQVSGVNNTTGVALVEVYQVQ